MKNTAKRTLGLLGGWLLAILPLAAGNPNPSMTLVSNVACGSVMPGATAGTLILANSPVPSGVRSVTGGTALGGSPVFALGAFTLTGNHGDSYTIANGGGATSTLSNGSKTMTVAFSSVTLTSRTGTFPAGFGSTTTPTLYFGLTVTVFTSALNPAGTYTGTLCLKVRDTTNGRTSSALTFTITVKVDATPITITKTADLAFGAIFPSATAGTVVMSTAGARTTTGGATLGAFKAGSAACFTLTGAASALFATTFSPASITLTAPGGTLTVDTFTSSPAAMGADGTRTLTVGATVHVGANQAQGNYTGTFSVTVSYD